MADAEAHKYGTFSGEEQQDSVSVPVADTAVDGNGASQGANSSSSLVSRPAPVEITEPLNTTLQRAGVLLVLNGIFATCYFLLFAGPGLGYGDVVFRALRDHEDSVAEIFGAAIAMLVLLYLWDASQWTDKWIPVRTVLLLLCSLSIIAAIMLAGNSYPGAPVAMYILLVPVWMMAAKRILYRKLPPACFLLSLSIALASLFGITLIVWLTWVFPDNDWDGRLRDEYAVLMRCNGTFPGQPNTQYLDKCLTAYVLWIAPLLVSVAALVFAFLSWVLTRSMRRPDKPITQAVRVFLWIVLMAVVGVWVAASVAGSGARVSNSVNLFIAVALVLMFGVLVGSIGFQPLMQALQNIPLIRKAMAYVLSNWMKALFLMAITPLSPFYFLLSFLNQRMRDLKCFPCTVPPGPGFNWVTQRLREQWANMKAWRWSSVLVKVMWIGLFYIIISVGVGKMVTLFLSWLNEKLESLSIALVSVIFILVGITIFLLPPVPGVPVYLAAGVILVSSTRSDFGFWGAIAYASFISFMLKMMAIAIQQKIIGERLSGSVWVRKTVGINSVTIQAIRVILEKPGMSLPKVFILCGGPDWPTSVLTGILRLSLFEMLLGSLPVILLVIPVVLAGAFLLREQDGGIWGSLFGPTITVAALTQLCTLMAALYHIENVAEKNQAELEALPKDPDVLALETKAKQKHVVYKTRVDWHKSNLPLVMKLWLISGAVAVSIACYIVIFLPDATFEPFQVSDSIDQKLDGSAINIFKTFGWIVLGLTIYTMFVLWVFGKFAARRIENTSEEDVQQILATVDPSADSVAVAGQEQEAAENGGEPERPTLMNMKNTTGSATSGPGYTLADPGSNANSPKRNSIAPEEP